MQYMSRSNKCFGNIYSDVKGYGTKIALFNRKSCFTSGTAGRGEKL